MSNTQNTAPKKGRPAGQSRSEIQLIGYLRPAALAKQLNALVAAGKIGHWWAVEHEPDEDARKVHFHIRMVPPLSRAVDWNAIVASVVEQVPGEDLPRRLVASPRAVNDAREDGLLYARHDRRYCDAKGEAKAHYDYPRDAFLTDDGEWLDALWNAADQFTPAAKRKSAEDLANLLDRHPDTDRRTLLRLCLRNGITKGTFDMLCMYRDEAQIGAAKRAEKRRAELAESGLDDWPEEHAGRSLLDDDADPFFDQP